MRQPVRRWIGRVGFIYHIVGMRAARGSAVPVGKGHGGGGAVHRMSRSRSRMGRARPFVLSFCLRATRSLRPGPPPTRCVVRRRAKVGGGGFVASHHTFSATLAQQQWYAGREVAVQIDIPIDSRRLLLALRTSESRFGRWHLAKFSLPPPPPGCGASLDLDQRGSRRNSVARRGKRCWRRKVRGREGLGTMDARQVHPPAQLGSTGHHRFSGIAEASGMPESQPAPPVAVGGLKGAWFQSMCACVQPGSIKGTAEEVDCVSHAFGELGSWSRRCLVGRSVSGRVL